MSNSVGSSLIASIHSRLLALLSVDRDAPVMGVGGEQVLIGIHMHDSAAEGMGQFVRRLLDHLNGYRRFACIEIGHFLCFVAQMLICCKVVKIPQS